MMEKPKRPLTAFLLWLNSVRREIKAKNPGIKATEIAKKGGEMWRKMKDKSKWVEMAAKARRKYARDLALYKNRDRSPYTSCSDYSGSSSYEG